MVLSRSSLTTSMNEPQHIGIQAHTQLDRLPLQQLLQL